MKKGILFLCLLPVIVCKAQIKTGRLLWKYPTQNKVVTTPFVDSTFVYYGSEDGYFYCNSISDGRLLWKYATGQPIRSSATVAAGKVFFGCEDGRVYALDAHKGILQWKFATKGERRYDLWDYYRSSPVYYKGRLYVGSGDGNVYAIDARNGKELWHYATGDVVHADPAVSNDTLFIGGFDGNFYALHGATGALIWKFKTIGDRFFPKGEIQKAALVTKDAVYFGSRDYNIYALNKSTGIGLWNMKEYGSWVIATPMEKGGKLFFGTSDSHAFYSLNNFYGEVQWKARLPLRSYNTPVAYDTLIFSGCYDGCLYGFGEKGGQIEWRFQTAGSSRNYFTVFDSTGHFRKDFTLYGNDSITLASEQKIMGLGAILSTPAVKGGVLYFGSTDGHLYAVRIDEDRRQ
ncbi:PQQ-binding-like beta-propeller repeat protein [Pseudoflavitalea sp. X16]|uniref:outer membrane protein assembly factor BamB family protein n=1 Tax=Paraflavitalea devenefica TaxID=2716334 RepID=UPI001421419C|nr:PQQ-binding-like beta-propeller repeat protein [Paraflavitalea devenefica]NII24354.1 PQQ-binding-like beta-propeller repeat protein [Paraflavitalea devenefica]